MSYDQLAICLIIRATPGDQLAVHTDVGDSSIRIKHAALSDKWRFYTDCCDWQ